MKPRGFEPEIEFRDCRINIIDDTFLKSKFLESLLLKL